MVWVGIATLVAVAAATAIGLIFLLRFAAGRFGARHRDTASAAFAQLDDFTAGDILIYLGSAIAFDPQRKRIAVWERRSGARMLGRSNVGAWQCGTSLDYVGEHTVSTARVQFYAKPNDTDPIFKVGVLDARECTVWRDRLTQAFGGAKER